ncbi:arylamine N-acetyltransferase [Cellulomonas sp. NPDC057328]|uniref:arylamine N-acetyltransferase family protein n=1 Tax=Cellulomonas sp. NPDC057328 TaxID=3346101 RepID=UPI003644E924
MTDAPVDHWRSDRLDLAAYLRRIRYTGPLAPDRATLAALHRAHVAAIPFENLDVVLGRGVSVDLVDVEAKLVAGARGGYCFEHGTLFGAVLEQVGFEVDRVLARTGDPLEHPRPRSHLVLLVSSPATGERWLADVGFGSGLLAPLALAEDGPHGQGAWSYELVRGRTARDSAWRLREGDGSAWSTILTFTEEPYYPVDVEVANENTSTSPGSPFTQNPVVVLKDESRVRRLRGREYTVQAPGHPSSSRRLTDGEVAALLGEVFGGALAEEDVAALVASLPPDDAAAPGPT